MNTIAFPDGYKSGSTLRRAKRTTLVYTYAGAPAGYRSGSFNGIWSHGLRDFSLLCILDLVYLPFLSSHLSRYATIYNFLVRYPVL